MRKTELVQLDDVVNFFGEYWEEARAEEWIYDPNANKVVFKLSTKDGVRWEPVDMPSVATFYLSKVIKTSSLHEAWPQKLHEAWPQKEFYIDPFKRQVLFIWYEESERL